MLNRRTLLSGVGAASLSAAFASGAQAQDASKRVGALFFFAESSPSAEPYRRAITEGLRREGWRAGETVTVDFRYAENDFTRLKALAEELVLQNPNVILAAATQPTAALLAVTHSIPIVFGGAADPIGGGFVTNFTHPGGNVSGFTNVDASMGGKWIDLLVQIAPGVRHAALMFNPDVAPSGGQFFMPSFEQATDTYGLARSLWHVRTLEDIDKQIAAVAKIDGAGLVLSLDSYTLNNRAAVVAAANRERLPAIYPFPEYAQDGGLLGYGPDNNEIFANAGSYVGKVLSGARIGDLPVQHPTKFVMVVNRKTAKLLGLSPSTTLLAQANEVIE